MRSCWNFYFQSVDAIFDQPLERKGKINEKNHNLPNQPPRLMEFFLRVELDSAPRFEGMEQTGTIKIVLPGDTTQTRGPAYWLASNFCESVTFSSGEISLLGGLVTGEYLADTAEEEEEIGDKRCFYEMHLVEATCLPSFDEASLKWPSVQSNDLKFEKQFNAAVKADNSIDVFLGLFKILESFYGPKTKKEKTAETIKSSAELFSIATNIKSCTGKHSGTFPLTPASFEALVDDLVRLRHECAHLKNDGSFGITHGDDRVITEVEPLIPILEFMAHLAIQLRQESLKP